MYSGTRVSAGVLAFEYHPTPPQNKNTINPVHQCLNASHHVGVAQIKAPPGTLKKLRTAQTKLAEIRSIT